MPSGSTRVLPVHLLNDGKEYFLYNLPWYTVDVIVIPKVTKVYKNLYQMQEPVRQRTGFLF